jgi:hypothetical protein
MTTTPPVLGYATGTAGIVYEEVLVALVDVLRAAGEVHWLSWMSEDLTSWRERRDTAHHRRAYGGMGSFNDLFIDASGWLGAAFEQLRSLASRTSRVAGETPDRFRSVRRYWPVRHRIHALQILRCPGGIAVGH